VLEEGLNYLSLVSTENDITKSFSYEEDVTGISGSGPDTYRRFRLKS
jgi:hypothetical protein